MSSILLLYGGRRPMRENDRVFRPRSSRRSDAPSADDARLGVGAQVYVVDDQRMHPDGWVGDPTGVIVASAPGIAYGAVSVVSQRVRTWVVVFDEPQYRADGSGPFDRAEIASSWLVAAPWVVDDPEGD